MTGATPRGFGDWLRWQRRTLDLTQAELARRVGCSTITLRKYEAETRRPSRHTALRLADILGVAPGDRATFVRFARGDPWAGPARQAAAGPPEDAASTPGGLPAPPTSLIGRDQLVASVRSLMLNKARLVTLVGPAGIGKTRLALAVAADLEAEFPGGVFFVPLASIREPDRVAPAIVRALGLKDARAQPADEQLAAYLRDRHSLLVLDNFEQVTAAAGLVLDLLTAGRNLKALVTSREALQVYGERQFPVPALALPEPDHLPGLTDLGQYSAIELFVERAQAVQPDFALTPDNAAVVAAICRRLDGLPLALELVAAHVQLLPPQALLARLDGRFALQAPGPRGLPDRHQTLQAALDWSYALLKPMERALLDRLAVFSGGFSAEAAQAVTADPERVTPEQVSEGVSALVHKNLVVRQALSDGPPRYALLETVRAYAEQQLEAGQAVETWRRRHAEHYLTLAETAEQHLRGREQAAWLARLDLEMDNLRAALSWALDRSESATALLLGAALWRFWYAVGGVYAVEGRQWLERALELPGGPAAARQKALYAAGVLCWVQADYGSAEQRTLASLELARALDDPRAGASALNLLGNLAQDRANFGLAQAHLQESLSISRSLGDQPAMASTLNNLGLLALRQGHAARAVEVYQESLALHRQLGNPMAIATALNNLGGALLDLEGHWDRATAALKESLALSRAAEPGLFIVPYTLAHLGRAALGQGDYARAAERLDESLRVARQVNAQHGVAYALLCQGYLALAQQETGQAAARLRESLALHVELQDQREAARCVEALAAAACQGAAPLRAVTLVAAASSLRQSIGAGATPADVSLRERTLARARNELAPLQFEQAWREGLALSLAEVLERLA